MENVQDDKDLGCCGYDELAVKPATTKPLTFAGRFPKKEPKEMSSSKKVPAVYARAVAPSAPASAPASVLMGRTPIQASQPNLGTSLSQKSIFEGNRGNVGMGNQVRLASGPFMGAPAVDEVLARESDPQGLRSEEAASVAAELMSALPAARNAASNGVPCVGVDGDVLAEGGRLLASLQDFSAQAPEGSRVALSEEELDTIEKILACAEAAKAIEGERSSRTLAFVLGGVVIGFGVIVAVS